MRRKQSTVPNEDLITSLCELKCKRCNHIVERSVSHWKTEIGYKTVLMESITEYDCSMCKKTTIHEYVSFTKINK